MEALTESLQRWLSDVSTVQVLFWGVGRGTRRMVGPGWVEHVVGFWDFHLLHAWRHVGEVSGRCLVWMPAGLVFGCGGCLLFENCIVDASIFVDFVDRFVW